MVVQDSDRHNRPNLFLDMLITLLAYLFSIWVRGLFFSENSYGIFANVSIFPLIVASLLVLLPYFGAYRNPRTTTMFNYAWSIVLAMTVTIAFILGCLFFLKVEYVSRAVIGVFTVSNMVFLSLFRCYFIYNYRKSIDKDSNRLKILMIGTGERAKKMSKALKEQAEWGVDIVGYLDPDAKMMGAEVNGAKVLGAMSDISQILKDNVVDEVVFAVPRSLIEDVQEIAYACEEEGIKLRLMADIFSLHVKQTGLVSVGNIPLLTLEPVALDSSKLLVKRIFDIACCSIAIPLILPLFAIIAIMIKLDSPGPVFFFQDRVGLRKRTFKMFKFRSMVVGSEALLKDLEDQNEAEGPIFKMKEDPRVTRVGKFIRTTSIDELPQLINVLLGHMSLVGPRPMSIRDVDLFDKGIQRKRFSVKPGITCIWQISGRSNLPFDKWLELDLKYIEEWSLRLDFMILLKTIPVVLRGSGAS